MCPAKPADTEPDHETLWQAKALVPAQFFGFVPARHPALRYGIALNDAGYFWEAQEVLEAVWAAAPQGGRERILLRACIQIASANLKLRMRKPHADRAAVGRGVGGDQGSAVTPVGRSRGRFRRALSNGSPRNIAGRPVGPGYSVEDRLDCNRIDRQNMKENADFVISGL